VTHAATTDQHLPEISPRDLRPRRCERRDSFLHTSELGVLREPIRRTGSHDGPMGPSRRIMSAVASCSFSLGVGLPFVGDQCLVSRPSVAHTSGAGPVSQAGTCSLQSSLRFRWNPRRVRDVYDPGPSPGAFWLHRRRSPPRKGRRNTRLTANPVAGQKEWTAQVDVKGRTFSGRPADSGVICSG
jgi:hypothetical protein